MNLQLKSMPFIIVSTCFISGIFSDRANAACTSTLTTAPVISFSGTLNVQRDAPIGSMIATGSSPMEANVTDSTAGTTGNGANRNFYIQISGLNPSSGITYNGAVVHTTNLAGVGLALWSDIAPGGGGVQFDGATRLGRGIATGNLHYALVKTGNITPGIVSGNAINGIGYVCLGVTTGTTYNQTSPITGGASINQVACSVNQSNINVPFGQVRSVDFRGVGSTTAEQSFTIDLTCNAAANINVSIDPSGVAAEDAAQGILALTPQTSGSNASGVGVQLMHNDQPFPLGQPVFIETAAVTGPYSISMAARYIQTAAPITGGSANAAATFTLTYQ
jgi:type 1 fimbria pilin